MPSPPLVPCQERLEEVEAKTTGPGHRNQIGGVASVERQFQNALVLQHLSDAGGLRLHLRRVGFDLYGLRRSADLQRNIDRWVDRHLQHDPVWA